MKISLSAQIAFPPPQDYAAMVTAMTSWKQIGDVLCLVARWLKTALEEAMPRPHNEAEGQRLTTSMATKNHKKSRGKVHLYSEWVWRARWGCGVRWGCVSCQLSKQTHYHNDYRRCICTCRLGSLCWPVNRGTVMQCVYLCNFRERAWERGYNFVWYRVRRHLEGAERGRKL